MRGQWEIRPIGDVCTIVGGGTPSRSNAAFYGGAIPWATIRDMKFDWIEQTEFSITPAAVRNSATNILPSGTVVVASRVGLGKVSRIRHDTAINQDLRGFIPKSAKQLDPQYLFLWFKSVADYIVAAGTGATVQGVTLPFLRSLPIPLPPIEEQRRIVAVLDEAFAAIATATANAEKSRANARELPSAALTQSGFAGESVTRQKLGSLVSRLTNGYVGPTRNIYVDEGIPYLLARHVRDDVLQFDGRTFVSKEFNEKIKKSKLKSGDVLLVQSGHIGHSAVVPPSHEGHNCHAMIVMSPRPEISGEYISAYLNSVEGRLATAAIRTGSTVPHLTCKDVKELEIPVPSLEIQARLLERHRAMRKLSNDLVVSYQARIEALSALKKSLLHRAFTGELTAAAPESIAA